MLRLCASPWSTDKTEEGGGDRVGSRERDERVGGLDAGSDGMGCCCC